MNLKNIVGFFHGIDPATKGDYYTDVVHLLPEMPKLRLERQEHPYDWRPYLVDAIRLKKMPPMQMVDVQVKMFNKYPPVRATIDRTREDFLASAMVQRYGETTILPMHFGNTGQTNTKFTLKQIGHDYLLAGYEWPNPDILAKTMPKFAALIKILKKEMTREIVTFTKNDRVTFDHPIGKKNDMVHGWEMSLYSVMQYQQKQLGTIKMKNENQIFETQMDKIYKDVKIDDDEDPIYKGRSAFGLPD